MSTTINIEEQYQYKDEIQHILDRSAAWIGSKALNYIDSFLYQPSSNKIIQFQNTEYNAGLHKIVDEIISNSIDESKRPNALFRIDTIDIKIETDGHIVIRDNGGIPVVIHKTFGILLPQMIFGQLRTSSNYDDSKEREWGGTNGLGAKLTCIYSKKFIVRTADSKNKVEITWTNNMRDVEVGPITPTKEHFTEIEFWIELERFGIEELNMAFCRLQHKRAMDAAATNPQLTVNFECNIADGGLNSNWHFPTFKEYCNLFLTPEQQTYMLYNKSRRDEVIVIPALVDFDYGFVNGYACHKGTHISKVHKQIAERILKQCRAEDMDLITEKDVVAHTAIFVNTIIPNPEYSSQTKEKLDSVLKPETLKLPEEFLNKIVESKIMDILRNFYNSKYAKEKAKELRKLNSAIKNTKTNKLVKSNSHSKNQELWCFEGDSAGKGFRMKRSPEFQSAFFLRGKIKNTLNLRREQILENEELRTICAICKLQFEAGATNVKNFPFAKFIIGTDMDFDGHHIAGLFIAFFAKHFPELLKAGLIYRALSPIVIVKGRSGGANKKYYYSLEEFEKDKHLYENSTKWKVNYCKGLGSLENEDYSQMLHNQKLVKFEYGADTQKYIDIWFSKATEQRKDVILGENDFDEF